MKNEIEILDKINEECARLETLFFIANEVSCKGQINKM